jgi:hypothetical protein
MELSIVPNKEKQRWNIHNSEKEMIKGDVVPLGFYGQFDSLRLSYL